MNKPLNKWLYFLKNLPDFDGVPEIFKGDVIFEKAFAAAEIANLTTEDWSLYHRAMKYEWDDYARYTTAEQRGENKGVKKVAKALLEEGSDPAFVAKVTGLSIDQIQQLQKPAATIHKLYQTKE